MSRGAGSLGRTEVRDRIDAILRLDRQRRGLSPADREYITLNAQIEMHAEAIRRGLSWAPGVEIAGTILVCQLGAEPWGAWQAQRADTGAPLVTIAFPLHRLAEPRTLANFVVGMKAMRELTQGGAPGSRHLAPLWRIDGTLLAYGMPAMHGRSLADFAYHHWSARQRLVFLRELIEGAAALHQSGYVHGNIKPSNVLIDDKGSPRLSECGSPGRPLAELEGSAAAHGLFPFIAPEIGRSLTRPDVRADVYALGRIAHMVAAGLPPGPRLSGALAGADVGQLPRKLGRLISRATDWDPGQRFESAAHMLPGMKQTSGRWAALALSRSGP